MSSSLVAKVLSTTAKVEVADLKGKINDIHNEITSLKTDVNQFIEDNYIDFVAKVDNDTILMNRMITLIGDIKDLKIRIENQIKVELSGSTKEVKTLSQSLEAASISLDISAQLLDLHMALKNVEHFQREEKYVEAAKNFMKIRKILNKRSDNDLQLLNIYLAIKDAYLDSYSVYLTTVKEIWDTTVCWSDCDSKSPENKSEIVSLTLDCQSERIEDLVEALHLVEDLTPSLHFFCSKLLKNFIIPIIHYSCSVYVVDHNVFNVKINNAKQSPCYKSTLYNIRLLFGFLNDHFHCSVKNRSFIALINEDIFEPVAEELIKNCISKTIPNSSDELQNFKAVENEIHNFENFLLEIRFISPEELFLSEYVNNVDNLYIDKKCRDLLTTAREIMKKDLHYSFTYISEVQEFSSLASADDEIDRQLSRHTFQLPTCQVSKSAKEILVLVRSILNEVINSSEACSTRLYYTSRNIFEMYAAIVPVYHKKFLATIPQQVALFHNNCMYFAHHLMTFAHDYYNSLPEFLDRHNVTYIDLTLKLRNIGVEYFMNHMKYQRNIIIEIIRDSGLSQLGQISELPASIERSIRQCLRQLELLKTVWSEVLPVNTYCKALGCITNSMIEDLVNKVITVEDIPAAVATDLVELFDIIVKRAPAIFPDTHAINRYVSKWQKLLELIKILEASLKDIQDRWADGKGPLAHEFTASQMKQLIRALFQNTERRAALLATIK